MVEPKGLTAKEERAIVFLDDVESRKASIRENINQLNSQQEQIESKLLDIQIARKKEEDILAELEERYPAEEPE